MCIRDSGAVLAVLAVLAAGTATPPTPTTTPATACRSLVVLVLTDGRIDHVVGRRLVLGQLLVSQVLDRPVVDGGTEAQILVGVPRRPRRRLCPPTPGSRGRVGCLEEQSGRREL